MISQLRKYLKGLDNIIEILDELPNVDNKSLEVYYRIYSEIDNEFERVYKEMKKEEIKIMKKGKKK